jgi:hypothetical protein
VRRLVVPLVLLGALLPACAQDERPEGIVERWLVALNQGAAGRPERYASDELSEEVLPGWKDLEPGELDVIEVGSSARDENDLGANVGFRVERLDGSILERAARVERLDGSPDWHVERLGPPGDAPALPSRGGPAIGAAGLGWWVGALGAAIALVLASVALMAVVRRRHG